VLAAIEARIAAAAFWQNPTDAQKTLRRRSRLSDEVELRDSLGGKLDDLGVLLEWAEAGEDVSADLQRSLDALDAEVEAAEIKKMLGGEHDRANAIVTIHPGAGGTESQDWAEMLLRMYLKWAERRGLKREILDYQPGEEAGLKSVTYMLNGEYAFGLMAAEAGVHRLVRISPFDQAARRHTSFASVYVWPQIEDEDADIEIPDKELRIDTYRSSGAGGQHVNVTDSAVRITHLPTGVVVSCQNERSQMQNKARAMQILAARLAERQRQEHEKELAAISGEKRDVAFGSQIRTYTLAPYQLVKDERTRYETGNVSAVLDGDLDPFIEAFLQWRRSSTDQ
jgi:peptide chain release factor 2